MYSLKYTPLIIKYIFIIYVFIFIFSCTGHVTIRRQMAQGNPPFLVIPVASVVLFGSHRKDPRLFTPVLEWDLNTLYHIIGITYHRNRHFISCMKGGRESHSTWLYYDGLAKGGLNPYNATDIEGATPSYVIYIRVSKKL